MAGLRGTEAGHRAGTRRRWWRPPSSRASPTAARRTSTRSAQPHSRTARPPGSRAAGRRATPPLSIARVCQTLAIRCSALAPPAGRRARGLRSPAQPARLLLRVLAESRSACGDRTSRSSRTQRRCWACRSVTLRSHACRAVLCLLRLSFAAPACVRVCCAGSSPVLCVASCPSAALLTALPAVVVGRRDSRGRHASRGNRNLRGCLDRVPTSFAAQCLFSVAF